MNVKVMYYSLTGNTQKLACAIADTLNVKAEPITEDYVSFSEPIDLLFIGGGIYFTKPSKKIISFIDRLDPNIVKNVAVFATYGGLVKIGRDIKKLSLNKGLKVVGEPFTCKGHSWVFLNRNHPNETDISKAQSYAKNIAANVKG